MQEEIIKLSNSVPVVFYTTEDGNTQLAVKLENDTVWLSVEQMAVLFSREESNIRRHILNVFKEGELERDENNVHFLHVNGVKKPVPFYSFLSCGEESLLQRWQQAYCSHAVPLVYGKQRYSL